MDIQQRAQAREILKTAYGASLTTNISEETGYAKSTVRTWFTTDKPFPAIEDMVKEMLKKVREAQAETKQLLNQKVA